MPKQENMKVEDIEELKEEMEVLEEQLMHNHRIDPNLYLEYDVKRGLRDANGKGVLTGLTEISGPGVSFECEEQAGMHIQEDHFIPEIINPDTGEVLPEGEVGELVFTCITKKAFPLIRYRTRDLCYLTRKKCSCGRTHIRMHKPMGRSDDMMVIKGVNVFPSQIETVLLKRGYQANYQIIVDRKGNNDTCLVKVELTPEMAEDTIRSNEAREKELVSKLKSMLGIRVDVKVVPPKSIERSEGKAVRVIDRRNLYNS